MKRIIIILILTIFFTKSYSQDITSSGKEFIFAFPPNFHTFMFENNDEVRLSDSLYVFIAAEKETKGYIEANDIFGNSKTFTFSITNPKEVYKFARSFWDYEMISYRFEKTYDRFDNDFGNPLKGKDHNEKVSKVSWRLVADNDVNVTILNQSLKSSDATLLYPVKALGKNYIVASYYANKTFSAGDTPSQFVVIASEDSTRIVIKPSAKTQVNKYDEQEFILNKGETYLVQSEINNKYDLTGSEVIADKPVAVFGSQLRATVPIDKSGQSRDYLIEQNLPTSVWGQSAFSIPFVQIPQTVPTSFDITRVIAANDNSEININGTFNRILNKGEFFDIENSEPMYISSNNKISVVQYYKSQRSTSFESSVGDPFMMVIPPFEQFIDKYKLISPNTQEIRTNQNNDVVYDFNSRPQKRVVFSEHYVNVVIKEKDKNTLKINDALVVNLKWNKIPTTDFVYAQVKVDQGTNDFTAASPFGVYSYGFGDANSYGYVGGLGLKAYDEEKPKISSIVDCFEAKGVVTDSLTDDTGIASIDETGNNNLSFDYSFVGDSSVVNFSAKLIDIHQDGETTIIAKDNYNLEERKTIEIPGFTVSVNSTNDKVSSNSSSPAKGTYCVSYTLKNYGKFDQIIEDIDFDDKGLYSIDVSFPLRLKPSETKQINICMDATGKDSVYNQVFSLVTACANEERIEQIVEIRPDSKEPEITATYGDCDRNIDILISENDEFDYGVRYFRVLDSTNVLVNNKVFDAKNLLLNIKVIDPYQDAYIKVEVEDSAGFKTSYEREIPGYTLSFGEERERNIKIDLGNVIKSSKNCLKIPIYNYGNYPITYDNFRLTNNTKFSIPLSQFPLTIFPNDSNYIEICMLSNDLGVLEKDTLLLSALCIETEIPMDAFITRVISETNAKCDLKVIVKEKAEFSGFGEVYPNPVVDKLNIEMASVFDGLMRVYILDNIGNAVLTEKVEIHQGFYVLEIDVSKLNNGSYTIIFEFEGSVISRKFVIVK